MHPATLLRRIALTLLSACALTTLVEAQSAPKALVYCPVGLDTSGCDNVVAALSAPGSAFTGGVDRGYDGSGATVDLAAANLAGYAVIVVPSLADDPQTKPYARLRNATVAAHLRAALTGHRAVWSGTPDLGTANPAEKTALLQNLATWAAGGSGTGLVALLDNSDDVTLRYDWLPGVAGFAVVADTSLDSYAAVQSLTGAGAAIVTVGGQALAYGNMAAFGIHAAVVSGVSEDVRGVAVDGSAGMPVLVTAAGSAPTTSTPPPPPPPPAPSGLRALVYCPVSLDSRSCDNVIAALTASGTSFAGGVDRGYNGAGGTVDLRTADLSPYGVFIVPSLADGEQAQPYAMLRDPAVAGRLKPILQGPVAVWSGTPDLGDSSQEKKNILIMNLAKWAAGARLTAGQQGLVAFQDASDAEAARYDWLSQISRASVTADTSLDLYSNVQALTPTAVSLLNDGNGLQLGYTNMASFGLFPGTGLGADATGGRTASVVLATSASASGAAGGIAMITTDKEDYQPGDMIIVTGAGWQPGETVTLLFHEEVSPPIHPDKVLTAVADANGRIFNDQYEVEESDVGVRFTLKATGQMSGRVAQTTFTDGNLQQVNLTPASATVASGGTATYSANVTIGGNANLCTVTLQVVSGLPSGATAAFSGGPNPATTNTNFSRTLTITTGIGTSPGTYSFTVRAIRGANCQGNGDEITTGTLVVTGAGTSTQVASNLNPSSFGQPVTFSATVATGSTPVTSGSVTFIEGGTCAAPTTTLQAAMPVNGSGQVTFTSSTLSVGSHTIIGCYGGSAGFTASSGNVTQTVNAAATSLTVAAASGTYQGTAALSATLTAGGTGLSGKTVAFMLNGTNVGSALTNGSGVATLSAASLGAIDVGIYPNGVAASFAGDVSFTAASASNALTVSQKAATITLANLSQTYDGTPKSVIVTTNPAGLNTTVTYNGSATAPTNAGSYAVVATVTDPNYQGNATGTLVIGPAAVTGHFTAANKQYDGTTTATILTRNVTGALGSDVVTLNGGTATFADKNVGTAKTVTATGFTLGGPAGANYVLASTTLSTTANITPRPLAVTATAQSKPYDGTTSAVVTLGDDRVSGDVFTVTASSASFADKHVGAAKTVTVSGLALSGADAGNYQLTSTSITTTADITPAALVPHITADNKIYDGTPSATILTRTLTGALGADVVMLTGGTATFADKHVGIGKTVTASGFTLAGADAGNYTLNPATATTTANITPRTLTVTADGQDKVYDATVNAAVTLHDDRVAGDAITVTYAAAAFADKNVGTAKPVSVSGIIVGGADGGNYQLASTTASATANITPAAVAPHITASNKEYDGTTAATILTRTLAGVLGSDDVALTGGSASFADKHAGNGKTVTGIGFGLAGADAGNYQLVPMTATTTADITPRTLAVTATGQNKVYDGTTSATVMLHDDRLAGDNLALTYAAATFADKNVGNGKPVTVNGIAIGGGTDAGNYHLGNTSASTTADITPAAVAPVITASSKEYDGTTDAVIASRALTGVIAPDVVTLTGGTASFADKNVGTGKIVTGIAFALAGADAGNYKLAPLTATTTADITPRPITVTANAQTKVYGDNDPALTYMVTVGSLVTGDGFTGNLTRVAGETVPGGPYAIEQGTLTAGGNYNLSFVGANLTITPAPLTVTADDTSKVFGDAVPAPLTGKIVGLRFSDQITVSYTAYVATGGMVLVGATTPVSGSPYPIIPSVSDPNGVLANYTLTPANGNLTVKPATPAYTASPLTVIFGTATTTIAGNVAYTGQGVGGQTVVPGGSVQITFNGMTLPATINAGGGFSANFNTTTVDVTGNPYPVSFNYAAGQDANFTAATGGTQLTIIDQTAPVTSNVAANPNPVPAGALTTLSGTVSDAGTGSSTIKQFEYSTNGGATWTPMALPGTSITQPVSTTLNLPTGVYSLCLRGTDFAGNTSAPQCTLAAVYDASAGFVTGGGWINSPAGAYVANPSLTGKANFGFVSKYQKGATVPTGDTEFQFQTAGLNFKSTSYDWLVISGSFKAQYKGTGTLNGQPGYSFMLTAIDGSQQGGGKAGDTFRIKIIAPNGGLVYDNQLNAPDTTDPTTILGGGSIVIHK